VSRTGSWFWSREVQAGPLRVHFFRMPRSSVRGFAWAYRLTLAAGRLHTLITIEPKETK